MISARAELVNGSRDQLLARARFAQDQNSAVRVSHLLDGKSDSLHRLALAGQLTQVPLCLGCVAKVRGLVPKPLQLRKLPFEFGNTQVSLPAAIAGKLTHAEMLR